MGPRPQGAAQEKLSPLGQAVEEGSADRVRALLEAGADPGAQEPAAKTSRWFIPTPLWRSERSPEIRGILLEKCAQIYVEGQNCKGALFLAAQYGHLEVLRSLIVRGADLKGTSGGKVLDAAVRGGHMETIKLLLDQGVDPRQSGALYWAARSGQTEIARLLLARGVEVSGPEHAKTLAITAAEGHLEAARLLIEAGVDTDAALANLELWIADPGKSLSSYPRSPGNVQEIAGYRAGIKMIERLTASRQSAQSAAGGGLGKEELATIVKAAVEGAAKAGKPSAPPAELRSDVDEPAFRLAARPEDFAIVVGIERYSDLPAAQFAERDAGAVKNHLLAMGVPSRNLVHLSGEKAGYKALEKFLETWLPRNVSEKSRVFFYFSGHGAPDPTTGQAYLLPWDGDPSFLENTGYPLRRLYQKLGSLKAKEIIVALDACFSGAGGRSVLAQGARPLVTKVESLGIAGDRMVILAAASGDQITSTREDQGHGTFTYHFLKGLGGDAKGASGAVTVRGLYDYLKPRVQDDASRQNREQSPALQGAHPDLEIARFR